MPLQIAPDVLNLLETATFSGDIMMLARQLERKEYIAVNKAIEALGGKWNTKRKCHVFPGDARTIVQGLTKTEKPTLPHKNPLAFFPTPTELVELMLSVAEEDLGQCEGRPSRVLEPSAGDGRIIRGILERYPKAEVTAVELDGSRAGACQTVVGSRGRVFAADFLTWNAGVDEKGEPKRFELVVTNPPFSVEEFSNCWADHLARAWELLAVGGQIVAIAPSSVKNGAVGKVFKVAELVRKHGSVLCDNPPETFAESGTKVNTVLLSLRKPADDKAEPLLNSYEAKRAARADRLAERARKLEREADRASERAWKSIEQIPPGQPILVGHHSEKRHRRDLAKHDNAMRKACDLRDQAAEASHRALAASLNTSISSDDPDAVRKLREKLEGLARDQARFKTVNAAIRRKDTAAGDRALAELGCTPEQIAKLRTPDFCGRIGIPDYVLSNNNGNMRRIRERIEQLERARERQGRPDRRIEAIGCTVRDNVEANRLQLEFDSRPNKEIVEALKRNGFRWAPSEQAWQRQRNNAAEHAVGYVATRFGGTVQEPQSVAEARPVRLPAPSADSHALSLPYYPSPPPVATESAEQYSTVFENSLTSNDYYELPFRLVGMAKHPSVTASQAQRRDMAGQLTMF